MVRPSTGSRVQRLSCLALLVLVGSAAALQTAVPPEDPTPEAKQLPAARSLSQVTARHTHRATVQCVFTPAPVLGPQAPKSPHSQHPRIPCLRFQSRTCTLRAETLMAFYTLCRRGLCLCHILPSVLRYMRNAAALQSIMNSLAALWSGSNAAFEPLKPAAASGAAAAGGADLALDPSPAPPRGWKVGYKAGGSSSGVTGAVGKLAPAQLRKLTRSSSEAARAGMLPAQHAQF